MIKVNLEKAKEIANEKRRAVRNEKFAPLDVKATIPAMATEAEAQRQVIRDEDAAIQAKIETVASADELVEVIKALEV